MVQMAGREAEIECLGHCTGGDGADQREIAYHIDEALPPTIQSEADRSRYIVSGSLAPPSLP
jgi:hypothetical protein